MWVLQELLLQTSKFYFMKKELLLFILISNMIASCNAQNLSKAIENRMGGKLFLNTSGNIYVKESNEKTLLLLFRSNGIEESSFDKSFIIFSENSIPKISFDQSDDFEIKIPGSKKYAAIYNVTKNKIYFIGTSDSKNEINTLKNNPELKSAVTNSDYLGYGFSYMTATWSVDRIKESKYTTPFYSLDYANTQNTQLRIALPPDDDGGGALCDQGQCTSGGNGSSSCSIGEVPNISCSVTCNSGFYACCNSSSTRCYCCKY